MKFQLKKKSKEVLETVIKMTEIEAERTVGDILYDDIYNKKNLTEIESMVRIEKAKIKNILNSTPEVKALNKKMLVAAFLYYQSYAAVQEGNEKIKELNIALKNSAKDRKEITKQTGFDFDQPQLKPQPKPIVPKK